MITKKVPKSSKKFYCKQCDYTTCRESQYKRHLLTAKHKKITNDNKKGADDDKSQIYICEHCDKEFKYRSGLSRHQKKCVIKQEPIEEAPLDVSTNSSIIPDTSVLIELLKQNQEFKQLLIGQQQENQKQQEENQKLQTQLLEVVKEGKTVNSHNTTNSNNKFNLNFFLNEQCKDAMNIADFVNNMVLTVEDLKNTGDLGYIDGITKIFADKLKEIDTYNRPMHCTDLKRETLYIKNNDEWAKDTEDKHKIKTAIECIANKNLHNLDNWKDENPGHEVMDSKEDKELVKIMTNSLGGMGTDREKNKQKIIKNVLKEIVVEK